MPNGSDFSATAIRKKLDAIAATVAAVGQNRGEAIGIFQTECPDDLENSRREQCEPSAHDVCGPGGRGQNGVLGIAPERPLELQVGAGTASHDRQRLLEIVAWRDVEQGKPSPKQRPGNCRQLFLTAEIDDVQTAAGFKTACGRVEDVRQSGIIERL